MKTPVQITYRRIDASPSIEEHVLNRAGKLETFSDRLTRCHVTIEAPHHRHRHGEPFRVRVEMTVPGAELVVGDRSNGAPVRHDLYAAIDDVFDDAARVLQEHFARQRDGRRTSEEHV